MQIIRLMADYQSWPLWHEGGEDTGSNLDPESLPLSPETLQALDKWAEIYESWLDFDNPADSPEPSESEKDAFELEGVRLWKCLQSELAGQYEVVYQSSKHGRRFKHLVELEA